jgi:hypothetical protein
MLIEILILILHYDFLENLVASCTHSQIGLLLGLLGVLLTFLSFLWTSNS